MTEAFRAMHGPHEYDCCECSRHILRFAGPMPEPPLCVECLMMPGWFEDPRLREMFDPGWTPPEERSEATP